jgi:hypothetical protein
MSPGDTHPPDCPAFEYEHHPDRSTELPRRVARIVASLRTGPMDTLAAARDTRSVHGILFRGLTPPGCSYMKLLHTVQVACRFFELVCRVHPYANGNGHAARFCIWAILARYGYFPVRWPIDPPPPDPPYTQLLLDYRAGNPLPLEQYLLGCLV